MGLTERHWFEDEEPKLTERQLEDALSMESMVYRLGYNKGYSDGVKEQKAENGEWITIWREDDPDTSTHARCSICNMISERPLGGYCKWCGAKMNPEWEARGDGNEP